MNQSIHPLSQHDRWLFVFDLDGTLTDSEETIYKAAVSTLAEYGIHNAITAEQMRARIGAHFADIFHELDIPITDMESFIEKYIVHYFRYIDGTFVYEGVEDLLRHLKAEGHAVALLTTKAQDQADLIIDHFRLRKYFDLVMGRRPELPVKPDPGGLLSIIAELGFTPETTVMIGDSEFDIRCGKNAGTGTVGCLYGFRSEEFLRNEQPDYLIARPIELTALQISGQG